MTKEGRVECPEGEKVEVTPEEIVKRLGDDLSRFLAEKYSIGIHIGDGPRMLKRMGIDIKRIEEEIKSWEPYLKTSVSIQGRKAYLFPPMPERK